VVVMSDLNVEPDELRVSARMADAINGEDLHNRIAHALTGTEALAGSMTGWPIRSELDALSDTWKPALQGLQERIAAAAAALRGCAVSHEWNETLIGRDFEGL
jgi:hypothetical protein